MQTMSDETGSTLKWLSEMTAQEIDEVRMLATATGHDPESVIGRMRLDEEIHRANVALQTWRDEQRALEAAARIAAAEDDRRYSHKGQGVDEPFRDTEKPTGGGMGFLKSTGGSSGLKK